MCERYVHNRKHNQDGIIKTSFNKQEIEYLLKNAAADTDQVSFNIPKKHFRKSGRADEHIEFEGFKLKLRFPNNLVSLKDGRILVCYEFGQNSEGIHLTGNCVSSVCDAYKGSSSVGFFMNRSSSRNLRETDLCLNVESVRIYAAEVKAKVVPLPRVPDSFDLTSFMQVIDGTNPNLDHKRVFENFDIRVWRDWYFVEMLA